MTKTNYRNKQGWVDIDILEPPIGLWIVVYRIHASFGDPETSGLNEKISWIKIISKNHDHIKFIDLDSHPKYLINLGEIHVVKWKLLRY